MTAQTTDSLDQEYWGDDEVTALDLSGTMLLDWADLTGYFNAKGYPGSYPTLLYFSDEAEYLSDAIFHGLAYAQSPDRHPRFVIDVRTRFEGATEADHGEIFVTFSGVEALKEEIRSEVLLLMRDGIKNWLGKAYSTHGKKAIITWEKADKSGAYGVIRSLEDNSKGRG